MIKKLSWIFFIFLILPLTSACLEINLEREEYLPKETLQAEINAEVVQEITQEDLFLYRGSYLLPQIFFITKVTKNKYFVWTALPSTEANYLLKVRGRCRDGLKFFQREFRIKKSIASFYKVLPKENFKNLKLEDHIYVALAQSFDKEVRSKAEQEFIARNDSCYHRECSTKQYALAALSFFLIRDKMIDNLLARQNYLTGNFYLVFDSDSQNCTVKTKSEFLENESSLELLGKQNVSIFLDAFAESKSIEIKINCQKAVNVSLLHKYKNIEKILKKETNKTNVTFWINNEGCWGKNFKDECDEESTVYAVIALKYLGREIPNKTISWLRDKELIMSKAVYYFLTKDNETLHILRASELYSGGWPKKVGSYVTDIQTSSITYFSLEEKSKKTESRLMALLEEASLEEKAHILFFIFRPEKIEPIVSFWPGIVKTKSLDSFNLILKNEGFYNATAEINFLNSSKISFLTTGTIKNFLIKVPKITTTTGEVFLESINIRANTEFGGSNTYSIPVLLFTEKGLENITENISFEEKEINKTKAEEIINATKNQTIQNETANFTEILLQKKFKFLETYVNRTINKKENFTITLRLANYYNQDIREVRIEPSLGLSTLISLEQSYFEKIGKNEKKQIIVNVQPRYSGIYSGIIVARGKINGNLISTNISVYFNVELNETQTCEEMNGTDCSGEGLRCKGEEVIAKDTFRCCLGRCEKEKKSNLLPFLIIIAVIVLLFFVYFFLKKKPKKEMQDILEEVQKKYKKRYSESISEEKFSSAEQHQD
ncbi:MAG: hypothetical protein NZ889_01890 [Candidatus Pacearchaeota archaeon]|nr:hypothetical protein [Candidatus Pacearchaeota archaeon]